MKVFQEDGGISSPQQGRFTFKDCPYLKLDVDFEIADPQRKVEVDFDPNDKIIRVSKLYVYYPIRD